MDGAYKPHPQIQSLQNQPPAEKLAKMTKYTCNVTHKWGDGYTPEIGHATIPSSRTDLQLWTSLIPCVTAVSIGNNKDNLLKGEWCGLASIEFHYTPATKDFWITATPDNTPGNARKATFVVDIYYAT